VGLDLRGTAACKFGGGEWAGRASRNEGIASSTKGTLKGGGFVVDFYTALGPWFEIVYRVIVKDFWWRRLYSQRGRPFTEEARGTALRERRLYSSSDGVICSRVALRNEGKHRQKEALLFE